MDIRETILFLQNRLYEMGYCDCTIAKALSLSQTAVAKWFNGLSEPSMYHFAELIDLAGLSIDFKEIKNNKCA